VEHPEQPPQSPERKILCPNLDYQIPWPIVKYLTMELM
jgi:hypothetical protein